MNYLCKGLIPALRLIKEIITFDATYLPAALTIFQKCLESKEDNSFIQKEALDLLVRIVKEDDTCILKVIDMTIPHVHNKNTYVKEATLNLLDTILNTDAQYARNTKVLDSLRKFSQDQHAKIRKSAQTLYKKYSPATS